MNRGRGLVMLFLICVHAQISAAMEKPKVVQQLRISPQSNRGIPLRKRSLSLGDLSPVGPTVLIEPRKGMLVAAALPAASPRRGHAASPRGNGKLIKELYEQAQKLKKQDQELKMLRGQLENLGGYANIQYHEHFV